jgi:tyrosine-protein kinase Etk/Wzc
LEKVGFIVNKDFKPNILMLVLKRNWYFVPILLLQFILGAFLYLRYTPSEYESRSIIQLGDKDQGQEILDIKSFSEKKDLSTTIELLRSQFLFERTIRSMNFYISYFTKGSVLTEEKYLQSNFSIIPYVLHDSSLCDRPIFLINKGGEYYLEYEKNGKNKTSLKVNTEGVTKNRDFEITVNILNEESLQFELDNNSVYFTFNNQARLASRLRKDLTITALNPAAKTVEIAFRSRNAAMSRDIVKNHVAQFFEYDRELENQSSQNVLSFIDSQLDSVNKALRMSQDSMVRFQYKTNSPDIEGSSQRLNEQINQLNEEIFRLEVDLQLLQQLESKINANPNRLEIYKILPDLLGSSYQSTLYAQVSDLVSLLERKESLSYSVTQESNEYKNNQQRIQQRVAGILQSIVTVKERLAQTILILKKKLNETNSSFLSIPEQSMEFSRLSSIKDLNEKYFILLMDKKSSYAISTAGYASKNVILQEASLAGQPIFPMGKLIYIIALAIGLFFSIGILALKYVTHDEINTERDIEDIIPNVSFLGNIPLTKNSNPFSQLVVHERPKSMITEAFRGIRSNLNFINPDARVYAVSSSISGEGKTFICLNFAGIKAMTGKKTILLDLDLRKPKIHIGLNSSNDKGMSTLLSRQHTLEECIQKSPIENLDFIPAGPNPPNPSELILSENMDNTLEKLKEYYDVIVIDNPPIGIVTDGMKIFSKADCSIYVFKAGYSKQTFAYRVRSLYESKKIKSLNVLLNGTQSVGGYGYGYGYGGYYEDEQKKSWFSKLLFWKKN